MILIASGSSQTDDPGPNAFNVFDLGYLSFRRCENVSGRKYR